MPSNSLQVRHLSYSPTAKTIRDSRAGSRWQGFLLSNGTRIRRKGARYSEIGLASVAEHADSLVEGFVMGYLEILDPTSGKPMTLKDLVDFIKFEAKGKLGKDIMEELDQYLHFHKIDHKPELTKVETPETEPVTPVEVPEDVLSEEPTGLPSEEPVTPVEEPAVEPDVTPLVEEPVVIKSKKKGKKE
jgi:hypothetical protein